MKKLIIGALLSCVVIYNAQAQENMIDSVNGSQYIGLQYAGDMNQILYIPYFNANKSDKNNFIIKQLNPMNLTEEQVLRLELPTTYVLKKTAFTGTTYLLVFFDENKKEDVILTVSNSNIINKKTFKQNGNTYLPFNCNGSENFILAAISPKGNYQLEMFDKELVSKWKKNYAAPGGTSWDIVSMNASMTGLEIIRKEYKTNGQYSFVINVISPETGEDVTNNTIAKDNFSPYPTYFEEKDGMRFSGGYFYKNSTFTKTPDGIFFASLNPEGKVEQYLTVPYSQIIEDLKSTQGNKLGSPESLIIFCGGVFSHESQTFFLTGQVITKTAEEGGAKINVGDFVTLKFSFENGYKGATAVKTKDDNITLRGDLSKTNLLDLGVWLKNANLLQFRYYTPLPGSPVFAYQEIGNTKLASICYKQASPVVSDTTQPICMPLTREPVKQTTFNFTNTVIPIYPVLANTIKTTQNDVSRITIAELHQNQLFIRRSEMPDLRSMVVPIMPDMPQDDSQKQQAETDPQ